MNRCSSNILWIEIEIRSIQVLRLDSSMYNAMLDNIDLSYYAAMGRCVSQCTGCMCNCRCSCYGGFESDFDWEECI